MPGRILNFSEFFDKYSKDSGSDDKNLDNLTQASANFEEGFDKETYDQTQLGPNKPVAGGSDTTPAMPGETGSPAFSSKSEDDMSAPEATETEEQEENETPEEQKTEEEEGAEETPEPEAGANPEEDTEEATPAVTESRKFKGIMNFAQFVNESNFDYRRDFLGNEEEEEERDNFDYRRDFLGNEEEEEERDNFDYRRDFLGNEEEEEERDNFDYRRDFLGNEDEAECETCGDQQYSSERQEEACPECGTSYDEYGAMCGCNM